MKDGSVSVKMINTLILGEAGVGKTSTKCILFNEPPPKDRTSTPLADEPLCAQVSSPKLLIHPKNVSEVKVQSVAHHWRALDDKQLQEIVTDAIAAISTEVAIGESPKLPSQTSNTRRHQSSLSIIKQDERSLPTSSSVGTSYSESLLNKQITIANINGKIEIEGDIVSSSNRKIFNWIGSNWALTIIDFEDEKFHFCNLSPQPDDTETSKSMDDQDEKKVPISTSLDSAPKTEHEVPRNNVGTSIFSESNALPAEDNLESVVASIHSKIMDLIGEKKSKRPSYLIQAPNEIFGSNWIYFIDSGGQPHFHNLLPHFVYGISVVLFVHRLSRKLEECPMVEYYENSQCIAAPYQSSYTTGDTLKCLVRSMQSHTIGGKKPRLVFIGTFLDKIEESGEKLAEKNEKLLKLLTPEFTEQLIFCTERLRELIFAVNAKNPGIHEERIVEQIRSVVESSPTREINIPIWWYVLEVTLKQLSARLDRMILSLQECLVVAHQLNISSDALVEALKFFHRQHIFLYYPDILPDVVFTSPQVLLDKLTELVREAYIMRSDQSTVQHTSIQYSSVPRSGSWQKFRDQGVVILEFLEQFKKHYIANLFTPPDLLQIFMNHLIITPLSTEEFHQVNDFTSRSIQYYMPSLLDMLSLMDLENHRVSSSAADPLLIRFPNGWPRAGVFCCLQVYLIQQLNWKLLLKEGKPKLIAQNCVMLSPPNSICTVTLIDSFSYFEIHVQAKSDICLKACPKIQKQILAGIDASCKTLRYSSDRPHLAFFCPCSLTPPPSSASGPPQHHAAELFEEEDSLRCTIDESVTFNVDPRHSVWLQDSSKCVFGCSLVSLYCYTFSIPTCRPIVIRKKEFLY